MLRVLPRQICGCIYIFGYGTFVQQLQSTFSAPMTIISCSGKHVLHAHHALYSFVAWCCSLETPGASPAFKYRRGDGHSLTTIILTMYYFYESFLGRGQRPNNRPILVECQEATRKSVQQCQANITMLRTCRTVPYVALRTHGTPSIRACVAVAVIVIYFFPLKPQRQCVQLVSATRSKLRNRANGSEDAMSITPLISRAHALIFSPVSTFVAVMPMWN